MPPAPTKTKNGAANATVRREVQASPNRSPARNWRGSGIRPASRKPGPSAEAGAAPAAARCVVDLVLVSGRVRIGADRDPDRRERQADRQHVGLVPGRPDLGGVPEDRPEAEEQRRRDPNPTPDRQPAEHPEGQPHVDRAEDGEDELAVRIESPDRDERHEHDRRQGRERNHAAPDAVGGRDRQDVLEEGVARRGGRRLDRVTDRRLPFEERHGLPLEMVVEAIGMTQGKDHQGDRDQGGADRNRDQERGRRGIRGQSKSTLCYPAVHLIARSGRSNP